MSHSHVVFNYGRAIVELAKEKNSLDQVLEVAKGLAAALQLPQLQDFLKHPKVPTAGKREVLQRLLSVYAPPQEFSNFLNLIIDRNRINLLLPILEKVIEQSLRAKGFEIVELISAQALPETQQQSIAQDLEKAWHTKVTLNYRENPNLIGGVIIRRGDQLIDGSLSGQLNALKQLLVEETDFAPQL